MEIHLSFIFWAYLASRIWYKMFSLKLLCKIVFYLILIILFSNLETHTVHNYRHNCTEFLYAFSTDTLWASDTLEPQEMSFTFSTIALAGFKKLKFLMKWRRLLNYLCFDIEKSNDHNINSISISLCNLTCALNLLMRRQLHQLVILRNMAILFIPQWVKRNQEGLTFRASTWTIIKMIINFLTVKV